MDIIDIMLARAMTPQGKTETYVAKANQAAAKAAKAEQDAAAAIATVNAAAQDIAEAQTAAETLLEQAQEALETAQEVQINTLDIEDVDNEIKKFDLRYSQITTNSDEYYTNLHFTYPDNTGGTIPSIVALKKATGNSEIAGMTQKAITEALAAKADTSTAATKQYVDQKIASIPSGGGNGSINLNPEDAGHIVVVGDEGELVAGATSENDIINALLDAGSYTAKDAVGLDIDYQNRVFMRIQEASGKSMGSDFDKYPMYGGRMKCNVADDGTINAFYGDNGYTEDGSNGQVMVYQPKFYYRRTPYIVEEIANGSAVRHESLIISGTAQAGFKLAPIFKGDLDYVLLPAYDGSVANNKLCSIAGVLPVNNITVAQAEAYANARGTGWHIMNLAAESANQMLEMVEFGTMNGQTALEQGLTYSVSGGQACLYYTGSTASLGNGIGHATQSIAVVNGNSTTQTTEGYRAIIYRGVENPWGHLWQLIGGVNVHGTGEQNGGRIYICTDFNYTPTEIGNNYETIGFALPANYKWINAMGNPVSKYDWVFMPIETSQTASSSVPVGDGLWTTLGLNKTNILASGGSYSYGEECGPFYYAADRSANESARGNYGAKLLYIPTKNATYEANIAKWTTKMGG